MMIIIPSGCCVTLSQSLIHNFLRFWGLEQTVLPPGTRLPWTVPNRTGNVGRGIAGLVLHGPPAGCPEEVPLVSNERGAKRQCPGLLASAPFPLFPAGLSCHRSLSRKFRSRNHPTPKSGQGQEISDQIFPAPKARGLGRGLVLGAGPQSEEAGGRASWAGPRGSQGPTRSGQLWGRSWCRGAGAETTEPGRTWSRWVAGRGSLGDMEAGEDVQTSDASLTEREPEAPEPLSPASADELELVLQDGQRHVRARLSLTAGLSWGPFSGNIQTRAPSPGQAEPSPSLTLLLVDEACWLRTLPQALTQAEANLEIYRKDDTLWCRVTKPVPVGGLLTVLLTAEPCSTPSHPMKEEPAEPACPAPTHSDIQLLPQQAGMASILATAVINKDVFPCKDCGIWYRSERNLQAHLLYYCASRQSTGSPATAAMDEKPKETYPNERVCPFPQCRKSCPSASSLEIHMRSHSGERPFVCLICLSAFTTKANCERHLKVHTDTLTGVCHSCGFISTTRDILYSHLVTNHMVCQPGSKGEIYSPGAGHPAAKLPPDSLASFQQHPALHGPLASKDLGVAPTSPPGLDRKVVAEATNGIAPQNGGTGEPPTAPRSIKAEAAEEPEAARAPSDPGPQAPSRTPSPRSPAPARVKAELSSPTPGSSPVPGELGLAGALFVPQYVFGSDAGAAPPASEILAKMSELVHSRLQQGAGGAQAGLFAGAPKGATCFECEITFSNVNNYYVHKRLYCSGRRAPEDAPSVRRPKANPGPTRAPPGPPGETDAARSSPGPGAREDGAGCAATPEDGAGGRGSEGSQSPGSSVDDADDDPSRTLCEACNIRFSRHETYTVHKRYYCASRHDPPPRRPAAHPGPTPAAPSAPPVRTRRRRKLYELHAAGAPPPGSAGPAPPAPEPPASPRPGSGSGAGPAPARSPGPAADGPIDLSKKPRRQAPAPGPPALADYHECTACRVSFHSLEAYLAHKKYSCPAAPPPGALGLPAAACPYCPAGGPVRGDLLQHFGLAHGLLLGAPLAGPGAEARTPAERGPSGAASPSPSPAASPQPGPRSLRDGLGSEPPEPPPGPASGSPRPCPPPSPPPPSHSDKGVQTPSKSAQAPVPNGNHRYCRLCNIKFSSLSTFIAHKKYYCSSHAAEHVK
ncbi:zinc finger protein ZFPM1 isoform X2 [Nycticebus coucang]|uniref:zinc finger protein ZFPM1 isoform X2 n=1 Tax=Nycticebus coucang TaxID=9470 RepID=UPI00234DF53C|nr:zinc finger protein ZFPM1 isoform X2 [Nycticebus coucang]